jgi:hypothetical protein
MIAQHTVRRRKERVRKEKGNWRGEEREETEGVGQQYGTSCCSKSHMQ